MATFYIKQGDTLPIVDATLYDGAGVVNLTGASVAFVMKLPGGSVVVNASCAVVSPATAGHVQYTWIAGDTATAGVYDAEFQVTFSGGAVEKFPNDQHLRVVVTAKLI